GSGGQCDDGGAGTEIEAHRPARRCDRRIVEGDDHGTVAGIHHAVRKPLLVAHIKYWAPIQQPAAVDVHSIADDILPRGIDIEEDESVHVAGKHLAVGASLPIRENREPAVLDRKQIEVGDGVREADVLRPEYDRPAAGNDLAIIDNRPWTGVLDGGERAEVVGRQVEKADFFFPTDKQCVWSVGWEQKPRPAGLCKGPVL